VEPIYWLTRQKEEAEMASGAASTEARLVHHELANRYCDKASQAEADTLACLGIERVPADQYWVNGFQYTNPGDAIAEAKRSGRQLNDAG
jgi:hypothetical protein